MRKVILFLGALIQSFFDVSPRTPDMYLNKEYEETNYISGLLGLVLIPIIVLIIILKMF